jgi:MFS family permease
MAWTNAATMLVGFAMTAFFVLMPSFVQIDSYGYGASLTEAGLYFLPSAVAMVVCGPLAGSLGGRIGYAAVLQLGLLASAGALTLLAFAHEDPALALVWMGLLGSGIAFALAAIGSLVIEHSSASETGVASGVNLIMRTVGASIGAQIAAVVITARPDEHGFTIAFALSAGAAALALLPAVAAGGGRRRVRLRPAVSPA